MTDLSSLDRLLERLRRFADMNGADTQTCREAVAALVALRQELEQATKDNDEMSSGWRLDVARLAGKLIDAGRERDDARECLKTATLAMHQCGGLCVVYFNAICGAPAAGREEGTT